MTGPQEQPAAPTTPASAGAERADLEALVLRCSGNMSAIARELSAGGKRITRQAVTRRLARFGLLRLAGEMAIAGGVSGRRRAQPPKGSKVHQIERERILDALAAAATYDAAAGPLGLTRRTLYRRIARYGITPEQVAERRATPRRKRRRKPAAQ